MKLRFLLVLTFSLSVLSIGAKPAANSDKSASDPGWPRQLTNPHGRLVIYQPQVDDWPDFKQLNFRMAFALIPKGEKEIIGIVVLKAQSDADVDSHNVLLSNFEITDVTLPSIPPEEKAATDQLVRSFLQPDHAVTMSLDRLVATVNKSDTPPAVPVQNDPPMIFVSKTLAILLYVDGAPVKVDIDATNAGKYRHVLQRVRTTSSLTEVATSIANRATIGSSATRTVGRRPEADKARPILPSLGRSSNATTSRGSVASRCNDNKVPNVAAPVRAGRAAEEAVVEGVADPRALLYMESVSRKR